MKELPKYFVIKNPGNTELWKKYINWLNKKYNKTWMGTVDCYYGFDGNPKYNGTNYYFNVSSFDNNPTVLTLEEWDDIVNSKEEFVLPEKWCIKACNQEEAETIAEYANPLNIEKNGRSWTPQDSLTYYLLISNNKYIDGRTSIILDHKKITFEQFKKYVLKQDSKNMIDYKIKGTELPTIPKRTKWRVASWLKSTPYEILYQELKNLVSYGSVVFDNEVHILAEVEKYSGTNFYMIKEEDILKLTDTKNMQKEIIGYKAPMDLFDGHVKKGQLYKACSSTKINTYVAVKEDGTILDSGKSNLPKEIVEQWEPVYKLEEKIINIGFDIKVTPEGIFHKSDNITEFVEEMMSYELEKMTFGGYVAVESDLIFSKTGCQNVETKLSDWKKVWETYQEISK